MVAPPVNIVKNSICYGDFAARAANGLLPDLRSVSSSLSLSGSLSSSLSPPSSPLKKNNRDILAGNVNKFLEESLVGSSTPARFYPNPAGQLLAWPNLT